MDCAKYDEQERICFVNDRMSGVMRERADDEKQRGEHVGSYGFLKKPSLPTRRRHVAAKSTRSRTHYEKIGWDWGDAKPPSRDCIRETRVAMKRARSLTSLNEWPRWRWGETTISHDCIGMKVRRNLHEPTESPLAYSNPSAMKLLASSKPAAVG